MEETRNQAGGLAGIHPNRLFFGSCFALIATAVAFAVIGDIMYQLKQQFVLTNEQVGWIAGAALWGFTISIFIFGPLCDTLGMKFLLRMAFLGHALGVLIMIMANGFTMLFIGALTIALGNGTVEAACNPLVATIYPDRKTQMLNRFHVWFPGGIVIGGLIAFGLRQIGIEDWRVRLAVVLVPTIIYGIIFLGQKFPATERVQSGITFGQMFKETFMRPLFLLLFFCMMLTASLELGPNRWVPAVLESVGIHGILVLVWINLLMAILRYFAGPVVHRLSPTGILFGSAIVGGLGLLWLSYTNSLAMALVAGTVFAVGVCYFWPTMLGVTSERVPKGGALALAMMGGIGMAIVGLVTSPMMGKIADRNLHRILNQTEIQNAKDLKIDEITEENLKKLPSQIKVLQCLNNIQLTYSDSLVGAKENLKADFKKAVDQAKYVLASFETNGYLPKEKDETAEALRYAIKVSPKSNVAIAAQEILGPAENYGGKMSFRWVAPLSIVLAIIFGLLYFNDRKRGGYKVEKLTRV